VDLCLFGYVLIILLGVYKVNYTKKAVNEWYDNMLWNEKGSFIGQFEHPIHGLYYLWFSDGAYGISRENKRPHCAYASLSSLLKSKGF
jgi:hypothetical protein